MVVESQAVPISILVGIGTFFLTLIILSIFIIRKKFLNNSVIVNFISDGGYITKRRYHNKKIIKTITFNDGKYIYNKNSEVSTFRGKEIFYHVNNPNPITFSDNQDGLTVNSENLKAIIETELIAKLFKKENVTFDNVLLLVAIIGIVACGIMLFIILNKGVNIIDNPDNILIIETAIKNVLASGV